METVDIKSQKGQEMMAEIAGVTGREKEIDEYMKQLNKEIHPGSEASQK